MILMFKVPGIQRNLVCSAGNSINRTLKVHIVSYLTPVFYLDLTPDTDQFVASPPLRYINPGCYVHFFPNSINRTLKVHIVFDFEHDGHLFSLENLVCPSGHLRKLFWGG